MTVILMLSAMIFTFLWAGYSDAELVWGDIQRRRAPPAPWRERMARWVRTGVRDWPGFGPAVRRELARVHGTMPRYVTQVAVTGVIVALVLGWDLSWWLAPAGFLLGAAGVRLVLHQQYTTWIARVTASMSDVVVLLKARLQAGETVRQAIRQVLPQLTDPVRAEWQQLVDDLNAGIALPEALGALMDRVPDRDVMAVLQQLTVYDRESVPADPFGNLAGHLSRMKLLKREYLVRRSSSAITVYTGLAFLVALVSVLAPTLYGLWVNSVGGMPL
ncbi:MAG: type II secretion system F family protein [Thermaerobacter sp.]|nr:type II secretion system F family protein [Thermaerobacter sp.]